MGVTVLSRARPLYKEPGIRAGSFIIRPQLNEQFGYDSNPIGLSSSPGSWLLRTSPSIGVNSDWSRNSLGANSAWTITITGTRPSKAILTGPHPSAADTLSAVKT